MYLSSPAGIVLLFKAQGKCIHRPHPGERYRGLVGMVQEKSGKGQNYPEFALDSKYRTRMVSLMPRYVFSKTDVIVARLEWNNAYCNRKCTARAVTIPSSSFVRVQRELSSLSPCPIFPVPRQQVRRLVLCSVNINTMVPYRVRVPVVCASRTLFA